MQNSFTLSYSGISDRLINEIRLNGMDIITLGDFAITNKDGNTKFTFEIPSSRDFDFVKENKK